MQLRRSAIVVGSCGQDGQLLTRLLSQKNYQLTLIGRENFDITNAGQVRGLVSEVMPDEVYFLAACHHSSEDVKESDGKLFKQSFDIHVLSTINFLDSIAHSSHKTRFFYASSSHIFPASDGVPQNEETVPMPENIYAITKYSGMLSCRYYRETKGVFASCGILYNHESNLRSPKFLSRKIVIAVARISQGENINLVMGDLDACVDWGYAPDYVDAMHRIMQLKVASDYVISSGKAHSVRQFVEIAFNHVGLDYKKFVIVEPQILTREVRLRVGNSDKLKLDTGWQATVGFKTMVTNMVDAELKGDIE